MRLIDRDAIHWRPDENWELYATAADIRAIPIVDAVVVTRCKDCKHKGWVQEPCHGKSIDYCRVWDCTLRNLESTFCSYGEPKEGKHADDHD
jgi:hypothetical protein